jgi:hypothetical protein
VPPDVTTGRVVVVLGGRVVVVVLGGTEVLVVVLVTPSPAAGSAGAVVVARVEAVVEVVLLDVVEGLGVTAGCASAVAPGCSRATVTPMSAAMPPESRTQDPVSRRTRASARSRDAVEYSARLRLTAPRGIVGATERVRSPRSR